MATIPEEVLRQLREAAAKRAAIPDSERTDFQRPDRFIGDPIGLDDEGKPFPVPPDKQRASEEAAAAAGAPPAETTRPDAPAPPPPDKKP